MKIIIGILLIIAGWLSLGIGFTIKCPHPFNTSMIFGGFVLIILGIILLALKKN